ncbi:MAG: endonuclease MutS2 [Chloroflexi bacterium]|nr:endonuclease MutS2 [Chloroflexota bacterium]
MVSKSAEILEFPKILDRLAAHTSFSASRELALNLIPVPDIDAARELQRETAEARLLLEAKPNISMGGVFDVREAALSCQRGFILEGSTLLDIRGTLQRATSLQRTITRLSGQYPLLADVAERLEECRGLQEEITRVLDDSAEVKDSASARLAVIRRDVRIAFDRLQSKINNIATSSSNAPYLQEQLVTQRNGRYVIPLKAEFKGRIPGVVHDQSSSGATLFIEPLSTVELNNNYRQLQIDEENEIRRILAELCELVSHESERIVRTVETLAYLDLIFARAKYADVLTANEPRLVPFATNRDRHPGSTLKLIQARHPLLPEKEVVPIDVELDDETFILVITGPNTGGKTVALKTIGIMILMSQVGLHLPTAEGAQLSVFEDVYADIGDEQSIEQSLSTFSSHMTNIIRILEMANPRSMVILDELGAGTDPAEGSALARALLLHMLERQITCFVTTHHPELKAFSYNHPGVRNASVEFDLETLSPTYRLIVGLPGRSNALAIATRLGLPAPILESARTMVTTEDLAVDDLLDEIQKSRDDIRLSLERIRQQEAESLERERELATRLEAIEDERHQVVREIEQQAQTELDELRREIRRLRRQLEGAGQPLDAIRQLQKTADLIQPQDYLSVPETETGDEDDQVTGHRFRLNETVWVPSLNSEGQIAEITEDEIEIAVGRLRIRAKPTEVEQLSRQERKQARRKQQRTAADRPSSGAQLPERGASPGLELDLRGNRVEEAIARVEEYLDAAYMAQLPFVRIIHGKGTGALRQAVRNELSQHPLVSKYMSGNEKEGGTGVTIVHLVAQH